MGIFNLDVGNVSVFVEKVFYFSPIDIHRQIPDKKSCTRHLKLNMSMRLKFTIKVLFFVLVALSQAFLM